MRVELVEIEFLETLLDELQRAVDVILAHSGAARLHDGGPEFAVLVKSTTLAFRGCLHDAVEMQLVDALPVTSAATFSSSRTFQSDKLFDIRMVDIQHHHFCGAARGAADF
jgi:hypothetical protein